MEKDFDERTHEVLARGVCIKGDKVLLCRQVGSPRCFLPGGHIDPGEGARYALEREIHEELGIGIKAGVFLGSAEHFFGPKGSETWELNVLFAMDDSAFPDTDPPSKEPWQEFFWWPIGDLESVGFEPRPLRARLADWLANPNAAHFASTYEDCGV